MTTEDKSTKIRWTLVVIRVLTAVILWYLVFLVPLIEALRYVYLAMALYMTYNAVFSILINVGVVDTYLGFAKKKNLKDSK